MIDVHEEGVIRSNKGQATVRYNIGSKRIIAIADQKCFADLRAALDEIEGELTRRDIRFQK